MILSSEMHFTHFINAGSPSHVPNHVQLQSYQKLGAECKHQNPKRLLDHCLLDVLSSFFLFLIYTIVVSSMIIKNNRILKKKRKIFFLTSLEKDNPSLSLSLSLICTSSRNAILNIKDSNPIKPKALGSHSIEP